MNKPTKTPYDQMPDKVRLLVDYAYGWNMIIGTVLTKVGSEYSFSGENGIPLHMGCDSVDLLLQAGWAEPVVERKKTRLARVKKGERYWFVDYDGEATDISEDHDTSDDRAYEFGNYVHTEAQAERARKAMHEKLMEVQKEFAEEEAI